MAPDFFLYTLALPCASLVNGIINAISQRENRKQHEWHHAANLGQRDHHHTINLQVQKQQAAQAHNWRIEEANWPLTLSPDQFQYKTTQHGKQPLIVIISPPSNFNPDFREAVKDLENKLRSFIHQSYDVNDPTRPVHFLAKAWKTEAGSGESAAQALYFAVNCVPTLILELEIIEYDVIIHTHYWAIDSTVSYLTHKSLSDFPIPLGNILANIARRNAASWGRITEIKGSPATDNERDLKNWETFQAERALCEIDPNVVSTFYAQKYQYSTSELREAILEITPALQLVVAGIADIYHLFHYNTSPKLPELLHTLFRDVEHDVRVLDLMRQIKHDFGQLLMAEETFSEEVLKMAAELRNRLEQAKGKTFTLLLIGRTGMGKSSTVNSLIDAEVAAVNDLKPCTASVSVYEKNLHGATIRVIDTPGLCDDIPQVGNDSKYVEMIRHKVPYNINAVLFVTRLDENRVEASEKRGLQLITQAFGPQLWKKAVIVFTHSGNIENSKFEKRLAGRTECIREALLKVDLPNGIADSIPSVAVDNIKTVNPDGQPCIKQLFMTLLNRVEDSSKDVLILASQQTLAKVEISPADVVGVLGIGACGAQAGALAASALGVGSTSIGALASSSGGAVLTGLFAFSNPIGWAIVFGGAISAAVLSYNYIKKM